MSCLGILLFVFLVCCSLAALSSASSCNCSNVVTYDFPSFSSSGDTLELLKDAGISNGAVHLTPASGSPAPANKSGAVFLPAAVTLSRVDSQGVKQEASLETSFTMSVLYKQYSPSPVDEAAAGHKQAGEGLAFVIFPTIDSAGAFLGLNNSAAAASPSSSSFLAVEFDAAKQPYDPGKYHISLNTGSSSIISESECHVVPVSLLNQTTTANNYTVWIDYKSEQHHVWVYMDVQGQPKPETACLDASLDLSSYVSVSQTQRAFIGFMASTTGMGSELHYYSILSWNLKVKFLNDGLDIEWKVMLPAVVGAIAVTAIMYAAVAVFYFNSKYRALKKELVLMEALRRLPGTPREFKHATMRKATNNFDEARKLGNGGFGAVYRGTLRSAGKDGGQATSVMEVAVKKFTRDENRCYDDFLSEVDIINRLRHRNIVPLVGTRALCVFHETFQMLTDWVWRLHREGRLLAAVDSGIVSMNEFDEDDAARLLLLGLACTNPNQSDRPSMADVLQVVTRSAPPPDVPLVKPAFVWPPEEGAVQLEFDHISTMSDLDVRQWEEMSSSDMPLR
ncbi:hypothetical protein ABZP36_003670 [Zizania latifolia]